MVMIGCSGSGSEYLPTGSEQPLRPCRIVGLNNSLKNDKNFKVFKILFILRQLVVNLIHGFFPKEKHNGLLLYCIDRLYYLKEGWKFESDDFMSTRGIHVWI